MKNEVIARSRRAGELWAASSWRSRHAMLARLADVFVERQEEIVDAIVADTGKPPLDALGGDLLVTLEHFRFYGNHAERILSPLRLGRSRLLFGSARFTRYYEPHGVALIYAPSNYPLQLSMVPALTALYAGNAVVLKMSEQTPHLAAVLQDLMQTAGLPQHLLQVFTDAPDSAGDYLEARPDFVCFTGSTHNGRMLAERAGRLLIPSLMELGGKDAAIVFADCSLPRTIEGVVYGAFLHSGQVCVGIKRVFVEESLYESFVAKLVERIRQLRPVQADSGEMSASLSDALRTRLASQIDEAVQRGARVLHAQDLTGRFPVILTDVPNDATLLRDESFGPILCIGKFDAEETAVRRANSGDFALGASIWTRDLRKAQRVASALRAPNIAINDVIRNIANPEAPFGGNGASGYGRYHGAEGLLTFSKTKVVMTQRARKTRERHWFPFLPATYRQLSIIIRVRHSRIGRWFGAFAFAMALMTPYLVGATHAHTSTLQTEM
ncbi:aldehyde dehydrogenase family protein [Granulicella cerasi]|uniref:Aldehyde dehydrogenase n=1 Tax=Granulicella cerasi TaxID=741063 RepID=A0ABW1Z657_9BACT|nr:aldehyde dehydrogenase family protein [Granulicella cerasi]